VACSRREKENDRLLGRDEPIDQTAKKETSGKSFLAPQGRGEKREEQGEG